MKLTALQKESIKEVFYLVLSLIAFAGLFLVSFYPKTILALVIVLIELLIIFASIIYLIIKLITKTIKLTIRDWNARACLDENEYIVYNDIFTPVQNKVELQNKINKYLKDKKEKKNES
jgi:hypothetical protein